MKIIGFKDLDSEYHQIIAYQISTAKKMGEPTKF